MRCVFIDPVTKYSSDCFCSFGGTLFTQDGLSFGMNGYCENPEIPKFVTEISRILLRFGDSLLDQYM